MSKRKRTMLIIGGTTVMLMLFIGINIALAIRNASAFPAYWQAMGSEPIAPDAIRLVALGDSTMQAIGAAHPDDGIAGRIASYLITKTGRPVHITNVSAGGAEMQDILNLQLPKVNLDQADLIIVATASDLEGRVHLDTYEENLRMLLSTLPTNKTIFSDLPIEPGRDSYQAIFQQVADAFGIRRADFAKVFRGAGYRLDIFSWLFPHLNSKGYFYWFRAFEPEVDELLALH